MINHGQFQEGQNVKINKPISWTNYPSEKQILPAGTILFLESWRPEGFTASYNNRENWWFVFAKDLKDAEVVEINGKYFTKENDKLVTRLTGFDSFQELVEQKNYTPTIFIESRDRLKLADLYDEYMKEAGRSQRAYRSQGHLRALSPIDADAIEENGFKKFNNYQHLPVTIPLTGGTITCNLPNDKKITFSFIPTGEGDDIECCDIQLETDSSNAKQHIIAFAKGSDVFHSNQQEPPEITLTAVLINDKYYK
jgi:hypothetical protein